LGSKLTHKTEASTLPLAAMTAACGLYSNAKLGLPNPWTPASQPTPIVVYGGASAVGAFVIQFARKSNLHPIIAVAGRGTQFVEGLIDRSKGDTIVDYRKGDDAVVNDIKEALKGQKLEYAFDAISEKGSYINIGNVLATGGKITTVQEVKKEELPDGIQLTRTMVGSVHKDEKDLGFVFFRLIGRGLQEGWFKPHPHEVVPGGLDGIEQALTDLKNGKASAIKYVFRIEDTPGIQKGASL
jgi:NADPH:quinone reductase